MARKHYSEESRRQAVDLYLNTPGAAFKAIAAGLGIAPVTLQNWVYTQQPETRPGPEITTPTAPTPAKSETAAIRIARLKAALVSGQDERRKLETERDPCASRPSISPRRRTGEPLPVRADHRHAFDVKRLCQVLGLSRSSFYAWCRTAPARAARTGAAQSLAGRIRAL